MSRHAVVKRAKIERIRRMRHFSLLTKTKRILSVTPLVKSRRVLIQKTEWPAFDKYLDELRSFPRASFESDFLQECSPPSEAYVAGERAYASGLSSDVPQWVREADAVWEYRQGYSRAAARDYTPQQRAAEKRR